MGANKTLSSLTCTTVHNRLTQLSANENARDYHTSQSGKPSVGRAL